MLPGGATQYTLYVTSTFAAHGLSKLIDETPFSRQPPPVMAVLSEGQVSTLVPPLLPIYV